MTNYTKNSNFTAKTGTPIVGSDFDAEFDEIATSSATKEDTANKGAANGYCPLDASTLVATAYLTQATDTAKGAVELATTAEAVTGTDTARAVTPAGLEAWGAQNAGMVQDISNLADPNADRILFWDDSAGAVVGLAASTGLTITGTNLTTSVTPDDPTFTGTLTISDADPQLFFYETDATTAYRGWKFLVTGEAFFFSTTNDAGVQQKDLISYSARDGSGNAGTLTFSATGNYNFDCTGDTSVTFGGYDGAAYVQMNFTYDAAGDHWAIDFNSAAAGTWAHEPVRFDYEDMGSSVYKTRLKYLATGSTYYEVGWREVPQNAQTGNYTLVLEDSGKHIYHASGAGAADTYTIPANASVAYPIGTVLTFINSDSNSVSIAITTDTMTLAGTTTTGTRTLAQNGVATAIKVTSTAWIISGTGLT